MSSSETIVAARAGVLGVIGHPVSHSLSPRIHNAAFQAQGLDLVYVAFDVPPDDLPAAMAGVRALGMRGVNVTVPHKQAVVRYVDQISPLAERVGAVNTVVNDDGRLVGHNTDVLGFRKALRSLLPEGAQGRRCLVVGAGGAARAVVAALFEDGAECVWICNRTHERAVALCAAAATWGRTVCEVVPPDRLREVVLSTELLVNATSVGLAGSVKEFALPVDTVHSGHVVVDLVYSNSATPLVNAARARGALTADGMEMLVMQAAESYSLWTGLTPPVDVMRESVGRGEG
ncbi:MAG: shikimate dehydrogenase [Thermoleophilia bacterium]|nr:shikimate dehydrogenase [Thermoleophilia bacterium]